MRKIRYRRYAAVFAALLAAGFLLALLSLQTGSVHISAGELLGILTGRGNDETASAVILKLRLPRLLSALLLGGALAVLLGRRRRIDFRITGFER